ncbi:C2H2 type zinc finger domain protein [Macrophomina phaseolina]|uniref:C2H2 type zinc finger domain protein n=1 Tax=Macrophomina phaseolina TaxID=35725 RepID=A0ABQ8FQY5_9PEZI|nr:C2H2 type zinc finger domain protein [Macrophomina phaseolina]
MPRSQQATNFVCGFPGCGRSYQRKEHLTRHQMNHFRAQPLKCPYCSSTFLRTDTLRRHVKQRHMIQELPGSRAPKACQHCRMRKTRCDGNAPQRITAYFSNFHPIWPFLHKGMFDPGREPALLLQSVVMISLWTLQDQRSKQAAVHLHEKLVASISQQREAWDVSASGHHPKSNSEPWPMGTYQGILLNVIFASLLSAENSRRSRRSASKLDLKLGDNFTLSEVNYQILVALIKCCLQRGMFSYPDMVAHFCGRSRNNIFIWVGVEETKRFALTLFKVWSRCDRDSGERDANLLTMKELRFSMPEREDLWDAPSHEELVSRLQSDVEERKGIQNNEKHWISNQFESKEMFEQ